MACLASSGYRSPTLTEAARALSAGDGSLDRAAVITFDDGYANFLDEALPILNEFQLKATVFVVAREVGGESRWDAGTHSPLMGWSDLDRLRNEGFEIGSHTLTHPWLTRIAPAAARDEVLRSRGEVEGKLGAAVTTFAYPYGDLNPEVERMVEESGYEAACSIVRGNIQSWCGRFRLKRVPMDQFTDVSRLRWRLSALYDAACGFKRWWREG
jgi:peptidoglycan/xylan/chitin deacetylase (PgdA/CDA1 family)